MIKRDSCIYPSIYPSRLICITLGREKTKEYEESTYQRDGLRSSVTAKSGEG